MVAVAIFSADPVLRRNLEQLSRDDPALDIVGMVDQPSTLRELVNRDRVDVLLADVPPRELLPAHRFFSERRQALQVTFCPSIFYFEVAALGVAERTHSFEEGVGDPRGGSCCQKSDPWAPGRCLGEGREWPCAR